ncbi:MAG: hypothetical protein KDF60_14790 [Calditrichaeota bacterium]|nr:hypothetical protein [Calditrichota bacterium]
MIVTYAAYIYTLLMFTVIIFQFCLTIGLPWGAASMGGKFPGKYPPKMRVASFMNMLILSFMAAIVLSKAGLILDAFKSEASFAIWFVLGFSFLAAILNIITRSKIERKIWAPVSVAQLICVLIIAFDL